MGTNYLELPYEALVNITDRLSQRDLLELRLLNHRSKRIIEALPVWQDYIEQQWLRYDDQNIGKDITRNFKYFINRTMKDSYAARKLKQIQSGTLSYQEIFETVWSLSDNFGVELTPLLKKLIKTLDRASNVCVVSYAKIILQTTRHKVAYRVLDITAMQKPLSPISKVLGPVEHFYFIVSHLDPSFDNLLSHREAVSTQVKDKLRFDKNFIRTNPTAKIIAINRAFLEVVQQNGGKPKFTSVTSEDGSILRVYCGETLGLPLMRLAIIQKIAFELGIHCEILQCPMDYDPKNISTGVMRIFDPSYPKNVSYVSLYPDFRAQQNLGLRVQTTDELSEELSKRKLVGRQTSAARFLKEFANKMLVAAFLSDMVEVKSKWDRNDLSQEPSTIFPVSKECLPHNNVILASGYFVLIQSHAKMASKKPGQNVMKYLKNCDNHSNFVPIILKMYPWDLGVLNPKYISRAIPIEDLKTHTIKEFFDLETALELVPDDINKRIENIRKGAKRSVFLPNFFPGQIIEMEGLYYVVDGYIKSTTDSPDQYSMIDVRRGMVGIGYETPEFKSVDPRHIDVDFIANQNLIGAYFERYDPTIQRFIPGKAIREVYPGLEKLRSIESYSENAARGKSMIQHPELEPLVFDQIPVLALHEPQLVDKLRKAGANGGINGSSGFSMNGFNQNEKNFNRDFTNNNPTGGSRKQHGSKNGNDIASDIETKTIVGREFKELLKGNGIADMMNEVGITDENISRLLGMDVSELAEYVPPGLEELITQQSIAVLNQNQQNINESNTNGNGSQKSNKSNQQTNGHAKNIDQLKFEQTFSEFMRTFNPEAPFAINPSHLHGHNHGEDPHANCNHHFVEQDYDSEEDASDDELIDPNDPRFQMVAAAFKELQNASAKGPAEFTSTLNALFGDELTRPMTSTRSTTTTSSSNNPSSRSTQRSASSASSNTSKNGSNGIKFAPLDKHMNDSLFDVEKTLLNK